MQESTETQHQTPVVDPFKPLDARFALIMEQFGLRSKEVPMGFQYEFRSIIRVHWIQIHQLRTATFRIAGHDASFEYNFIDNGHAKKKVYVTQDDANPKENLVGTWDEGMRDLALTIIRLLTEAEQSIREVASQACNQAWRYEPAS